MALRRSSSGSLSLREIADDFFSKPPPEEDPFCQIRQQQPLRLDDTGKANLHSSYDNLSSSRRSRMKLYTPRRSSKYLSRRIDHSFSVEDLSPSFGFCCNTPSKSRGNSASPPQLGGHEESSSSLSRFSAFLRKTSMEAEKRETLQRSKSNGFFDIEPPYLYSPSLNNKHSSNYSINGQSSPPKRFNLADNDGKMAMSQGSDKSPTSNLNLNDHPKTSPLPSNNSSHSKDTELADLHEKQRSISPHCQSSSPFQSTTAKKDGHDESGMRFTVDMKELYPTPLYIEKYLRHYIANLRLPIGYLISVMKVYDSIDSRLWLMENTSSMKIRDSHRAKINSKLKHIIKLDGHSRWAELTQVVDFHAKMSARCFLPTKFWLVNDPGQSVPQRFAVAWGTHEDVKMERTIAINMMDRIKFDGMDKCPLTGQLRKIEKRVREEAPRLMAATKSVSIVLCAQGRLTNEFGDEGPEVMNEFVDVLDSLSKLPVKIVVRLCAGDDEAKHFLDKVDSKSNSLVVLDDYWGEAIEVYLHNPWLTYGLGIHRFREASLTSSLVNDLGRKCFLADDIYEFCREFFVGEKEIQLPHPQTSIGAFMNAIRRLLKDEKLQWNPMKEELTPWIDMKQLEIALQCCSRKKYPEICMDDTVTASRSSTLTHIIQHWTNKALELKSRNPLDELLCTVQSILPPAKKVVEPHDYFRQVPLFSEEAFRTSKDDGLLTELRKRALRKMKHFIHPEKLPRDLTTNQSLLFGRIGKVIQEQELNMLQN